MSEQLGVSTTEVNEQHTLNEVNGKTRYDKDRKKLEIPEGMSKRQFKKQLKKEKWESEKEGIKIKRRERKKEKKLERKRKFEEFGPDALPHKKKINPESQIKLPVKILIDCGFDDMMTEREKVSLASQLVRCYAINRRGPYTLNLEVSSLNGGLLERFEGTLKGDYKRWENFTATAKDFEIPENDINNCTYLSSDSDNVLTELEENKTYIVGGIVDKGRYKNLCHDKAVSRGIKTARLPINEYIKLSGRRVLTTNHVVELLIKWFEVKDWKVAFEAILPSRKIIHPDQNLTKINISDKESIKSIDADSNLTNLEHAENS